MSYIEFSFTAFTAFMSNDCLQIWKGYSLNWLFWFWSSTDADYKKFLETLNSEIEPLPSAEAYLEELEAKQRAAASKSQTRCVIRGVASFIAGI